LKSPADFTLTWSSANVSSCQAQGSWSGSKPVSGQEAKNNIPNGQYTYTLSCTGANGSASDLVRVNVSDNPPPNRYSCSQGSCVSDPNGPYTDPSCNNACGGPTYQCSDGIDNDGDKKIDYPADPGCSSPTDNNEFNLPKIKEILPSLF
jgi:hypothetical protein